MPRPGPRPFECVRRAWHSDRHQPMRGSIIQEIFRLLNEIHSPATRKNKEWQEKLPVVVLKAEEIIYSKANSEEEYKDLKTLWERTNDAIDTIIRRDETTETQDSLHPCIEAALNLGCIPRRASRSQRYNPRFYLSSSQQESSETSVTPKAPDKTIYPGPSHTLRISFGNPVPNYCSPHALSFSNPKMLTHRVGSDTSRPSFLGKSVSHEPLNAPNTSSCEFPRYFENCGVSYRENTSHQMDTYVSWSGGHSYPLYYGSNNHVVGPKYPFQQCQGSNADMITVSAPPVKRTAEAETGLLETACGWKNALHGPNRALTGSLNFVSSSEMAPPNLGCDLSLRLGPSAPHCLSRENSSALEDGVSSSSRDGHPFCDLSPVSIMATNLDCSSSFRSDKEFSFFPNTNFDSIPDANLRMWSSVGETLNFESHIRKRKAPISSYVEDGSFFWWPKASKNQFFGRTRESSS